MRTATPEEMERLLDEGIRAHAGAIAAIVAHGRIAVVLYELRSDEARSFAKDLGWDGESTVFEMDDRARDRMATNCEKQGDAATPRWLRARRDGRIFLIAHAAASFLINFEPDRGFSFEPGSLDAQWMS